MLKFLKKLKNGCRRIIKFQGNKILIEDNYNILPIIKEDTNSINSEKLSNIILSNLLKDILTESDKKLLNLVFSENPKQEDLDNFLRSWDIEVAGGNKALMLAYFMKMHPNLKYCDYVAPRLKGLLQYYRFQNMKLISHYTKICRKLGKEKIEFLIFKGGCMKHLRPEYPRVMGDIDILVDENNFEKCADITREMGYDACMFPHSFDLHPKGSMEGIMDIHKYIAMDTKNEKNIINDLFKRATKQKVFGIETLVPCNEDSFFILLINLVRNLRNKTSYGGILYNLFDCKFLIEAKPDFDWDIIIQNAKKTNTESSIYLAIKFLNSIVPNILPQKLKVDKYFEKQFENYCILLIYERFFIWDMRQICRPMKIKDLFSSKEFFKKYLKLKPKYFILKNKIFMKNPYFAKKILKKVGFYEN